MKSNMKKRIIAVMLCMAMLASYGSYALAEGEAGAAKESSQALTGTGQTVEKAEAAALAETPAVQTETAEAETPAVQEQTPAQESAPAAADTQTAQTQTPAAADIQAAQTQTPAAETQTPAAQTQTAAPEVKHQDALELKQEIKDADGTVLCTVTANIEEGTFDANTEEVSMKVSTIDQTLTDEVTNLAKKKLASDKELGNMFLYKVEFQVNGTTTEPGKEVKLTFQPKDFQIDDTKKATVFYYNEANSPAGNTEAEIVEIIQKQEQIEALQAAGQSIDTVDEDYDLTEISLKEDGTADKIVTEGRRSTVYGCYLEEQKPEEVKEEPATSEEVLNPSEEVKTETPKEDNLLTGSKATAEDETDAAKETEEESLKSLDFENEKVTVTVTEVEAGAIPEGAKLKVVPILEDDEDTADQYKEVEEQIQKKAEEDEKEIEGFLAYDITFVDKDGNEMEPNSEVKVTMEYKKPAIPALKTTLEIQDKEVSVLHLEEDENGNVAQVVDMNEAGQLDEIKTGDYQQVEKVEMRTENFSAYTIYWYVETNKSASPVGSVEIHYMDTEGKLLDESVRAGGESYEYYNESITLQNSKYNVAIEGYEYEYAVVATNSDDAKTGDKTISKIRMIREWSYSSHSYKNYIQYYRNNTWSNFTNNEKIYMVYSEQPTQGDDSSQLGSPTHRKYIKENQKGEDYTLTLDVVGGIGEPQTIDVLMIVDKSGSMAGKRTQNVNKAINTFESTIKNSEAMQKGDLKVNVAVVEFANSASKRLSWKELTKSSTINYTLSDASGGTNWQAGVRKGEEVLQEKANDGNKKYVLFLTDGKPTYSYAGLHSAETIGNGSDYWERHYKNAVIEWKASPTLFDKGTTPYVVDIVDNEVCQQFADGIGAGTKLDGTSEESLETSFQKIAEDISRPTYKNVVITDTLSEWVDFKDADPEITIKKDEEILKRDRLSKLEGIVEINGETISVNISQLIEGGSLENGVTYSVSFDVKPTEDAKTKFVSLGYEYPDIGDNGTDAENNHSSSNQPGFYSNTVAKVEYTVGNNTELKEAEYKKPVVQINTEGMNIPDPNPVDGSITKTMGEMTEEGYPIDLEVKTAVEATSEDANVDVILVIDNSNSMYGDPINATKKAAETFVDNFVGENGKHRVGLVTYGSTANINTIGQEDFSNNATQIKRAIENMYVSSDSSYQGGGTNIEDAFVKAKALKESSTSNYVYVIFMTDGVPTYRNVNNVVTNDSYGNYCSKDEFNEAVEAANELAKEVDGIYTVGLLIGMDKAELEVARRLLAAKELNDPDKGYINCYLNINDDYQNRIDYNSYYLKWNTSVDKTYAQKYFEINSVSDDGAELEAIWKELAGLINESSVGSDGSGWTVTDTMADYITFKKLDSTEMNGHELTLSDDGKTLTTNLEGKTVTVARYDDQSKTITWYMYPELAEYFRAGGKDNYTYRLTYYVNFEDSGETELNPTNEATYVTTVKGDKIYPEKMPFYVNIVGNKVDAENTDTKLSGARFEIYKDSGCTSLLGTAESDGYGHFAFQLGQTDFVNEGNESYTITFYLKETAAPEGYIADQEVHAVTVTIPSVTYTATGQTGIPSGGLGVSLTSNESLVNIDESLVIIYKNEARPEWGVVKRNKNNKLEKLEGAKFGLYLKTGNEIATEPKYTGKTDGSGVLDTWEDKVGNHVESKYIDTGIYIMKEIQAPVGYKLSTVEWTVNITATDVTITSTSSDSPVPVEDQELIYLNLTGKYYYYNNEMLYELPSTGGPGIYWYLFGGVLLMMAASLIVYKNKRREVLKR